MLVLSRKQSEAILIGNDIRIVLVGVRGTQVRIGIEAPDSIKVFREELCTEASPPPAPAAGSEGSSPAVACCGEDEALRGSPGTRQSCSFLPRT
jgi:carbon storage regulator